MKKRATKRTPTKRARAMRDEATADETIAGSGVVSPEETEQPLEDAQLADDAVGRVLLYLFRHGEVYAGATADGQAIARVVGVPYAADALEALAAAGISA